MRVHGEPMRLFVSSLWRHPPPDLAARTERCLAAAAERWRGSQGGRIFFRADDIAVPGSQFMRLLEIFARHRVPLCLAVVPAWLTRPRWQALQAAGRDCAYLWCWHQHGWRHANHERQGKKQEFGTARPPIELEHDIQRGRRRLEKLMGTRFYPVFTPPWNRCDGRALAVLEKLGYAGVSRSTGSRPAPPAGLPGFDVAVDLHTRRETAAGPGWDSLFAELLRAIAAGSGGIMIHHRFMNQAAFEFLDLLLQKMSSHRNLRLVSFKDLAGNPGPL